MNLPDGNGSGRDNITLDRYFTGNYKNGQPILDGSGPNRNGCGAYVYCSKLVEDLGYGDGCDYGDGLGNSFTEDSSYYPHLIFF